MTSYLDEYVEAILKAYNDTIINTYLLALDNCQMKDESHINAKMYEEMQSLKNKIEEINRIYNIASYEKGGRNYGNIHSTTDISADVPDNGYARGDDKNPGKD